LCAGRPEKVYDRTSGVHVYGKSDNCIVPEKQSNKDMRSAEMVEGRRSTEKTDEQGVASRTQSRIGAYSPLLAVCLAARRDRRARFTALSISSIIAARGKPKKVK
jgi:RNA-directed DNA polymerase